MNRYGRDDASTASAPGRPMTEAGPLSKDLMAQLHEMPAQLQTAARFLLGPSKDVALLSMREQAKRAGVPPATMTRLAQRTGFLLDPTPDGGREATYLTWLL